MRRWWAASAVVVGIVLLLAVQNSVAKVRSLSEHGVAANGTVIEKRIQSSKSGDSYHVKVEFWVGNGVQTTSFGVGDWNYEGLKTGDAFPFFYDPADLTNTSISRFSANDVSDYRFKWTGIWLLGGALVSFCFWIDRAQTAKQSRQLAEWRLGSLSPQSVASEGSKTSSLKITGSYLDEKGQTISASVVTDKSVRLDRPISILIDPFSDEICALESIDRVELA